MSEARASVHSPDAYLDDPCPCGAEIAFTVIVPGWAVGDGDTAPADSPGGGYPAFAIDPALAAGPWTKPGSVEFGVNSWRGDRYFDLVRKAAREYQVRP